MSEQERLRRAFERNKEQFEQNRNEKRRKTFTAKIVAIGAFILTSLGAAAFSESLKGSIKPLGDWLTEEIATGVCVVRDQFAESNENLDGLTIVIAPIQNDTVAEEKRIALATALLSHYRVTIVRPCTKVQLHNSGSSDNVKLKFRHLLQEQLSKYDADLIIFGSVNGKKLLLYGVTPASAGGFNLESVPKEVDPDDAKADDNDIGVAFQSEMIAAVADRLTKFDCNPLLLIGCSTSKPGEDGARALSKAWMVERDVIPLAFPPMDGLDYHNMLQNGYSLALYLAESTTTVPDPDESRRTLYAAASRFALNLAPGDQDGKFWQELLPGQVWLKYGEDCNDVAKMEVAAFALGEAVSDLEKRAVPNAGEKIIKIFATLERARAQADAFPRENDLHAAYIIKDFRATMGKLTNGAEELAQQLDLMRPPQAVRDRFTNRFESEWQRLNTILASTASDTSAIHLSATPIASCPKLEN